ncbi:MAG: Spy/CpxP family protein refolding chaperone [Candidatus Cloacimonetes bacterium]|nr:Spy/CpxP family protein refolding chaperone [Candidatus Cloacimonadota bacterium]
MKNKKNVLMVIILLVITCSLFSQTRAERRQSQDSLMQGRNYLRWDNLNLTETQQSLLSEYDTEYRITTEEKRLELQRNSALRRIASIDRNFDEMRRLNEESNILRFEISQLRIDYEEKVYELFTPEQILLMRDYRGGRGNSGRGGYSGAGFGGGCCF